MDPGTHLLTGFLISQLAPVAACDPVVTGACVAAAVLPDLDFFVSRRYGGERPFEIHHGVTHTLLGAAALAFLVTVSCFWLSTVTFTQFLILVLVSSLSHLLLDMAILNNGLMLLFPSRHRYVWSVYIERNPRTIPEACGDRKNMTCYKCQMLSALRNPVALLALSGSIFVLLFYSQRRLTAVITLCGVLAYLVFADIQRRRAGRIFRRRKSTSRVEIHAYPAADRPFTWMILAPQHHGFELAGIDTLHNAVLWRRRLPPVRSSLLIERSMDHPVVRSYLSAVIFCYPEIEETEQGKLVRWKDLSVSYSEPEQVLGSLEVRFDVVGTLVGVRFQDRVKRLHSVNHQVTVPF